MTTVAGYPLLEALAEVGDFRKSRGKRHALVAILALGCVAALFGCSSLTAISQWGRHHRAEIMRRLGFTHLPWPSTATLHRVFSQLDAMALEQALSAWWQGLAAGARSVGPGWQDRAGERWGGAFGAAGVGGLRRAGAGGLGPAGDQRW